MDNSEGNAEDEMSLSNDSLMVSSLSLNAGKSQEQTKANDVSEWVASSSHFDGTVKANLAKRQATFGPNTQRLPRPTAILLDLYGVICSWDFVKTLKAFAGEHMAEYLAESWNEKLTQAMVANLREQALIDAKFGVQVPLFAPVTAPVAEQVDAAVRSIIWQFDNRQRTTAVGTCPAANPL